MEACKVDIYQFDSAEFESEVQILIGPVLDQDRVRNREIRVSSNIRKLSRIESIVGEMDEYGRTGRMFLGVVCVLVLAVMEVIKERGLADLLGPCDDNVDGDRDRLRTLQ